MSRISTGFATNKEPELKRFRLRLWATALGALALIWFVGVIAAGESSRAFLLVIALAAVLAVAFVADAAILRFERRLTDFQRIVGTAPDSGNANRERQLRVTLARINRELISDLNTDKLTGLHNRRAFDDFTETLRQSDDLHGKFVSLIMMDLDQFKMINDTYGHAAGDQVLKEMARRWSRQVRSSDMLARLGGEEFCLVLPDTGPEQALVVAEKMRAATRERPVVVSRELSPKTIATSVSLGVASAILSGDLDCAELLAQADQNLYEAKRRGRNQVVSRPLD